MRAAVGNFKRDNLKLLASDKEEWYVVLPRDLYAAKAIEVIIKNVKLMKPASQNKAKLRAEEMCCDLDLPVLVKKVNTSKKLTVEFFFASKRIKQTFLLGW